LGRVVVVMPGGGDTITTAEPESAASATEVAVTVTLRPADNGEGAT
jgi:hypothetical protein